MLAFLFDILLALLGGFFLLLILIFENIERFIDRIAAPPEGEKIMAIKKGDRVYIGGSREESIYKNCVFDVLSDPWNVCDQDVVKMKC